LRSFCPILARQIVESCWMLEILGVLSSIFGVFTFRRPRVYMLASKNEIFAGNFSRGSFDCSIPTTESRECARG
jgi:hypothetical protein